MLGAICVDVEGVVGAGYDSSCCHCCGGLQWRRKGECGLGMGLKSYECDCLGPLMDAYAWVPAGMQIKLIWQSLLIIGPCRVRYRAAW